MRGTLRTDMKFFVAVLMLNFAVTVSNAGANEEQETVSTESDVAEANAVFDPEPTSKRVKFEVFADDFLNVVLEQKVWTYVAQRDRWFDSITQDKQRFLKFVGSLDTGRRIKKWNTDISIYSSRGTEDESVIADFIRSVDKILPFDIKLTNSIERSNLRIFDYGSYDAVKDPDHCLGMECGRDAFSRWSSYKADFVFPVRLGGIDLRRDYAFERDATEFTAKRATHQAWGFTLSDAKSNIYHAECYVAASHSPELRRGLLLECLVRSLGLYGVSYFPDHFLSANLRESDIEAKTAIDSYTLELVSTLYQERLLVDMVEKEISLALRYLHLESQIRK